MVGKMKWMVHFDKRASAKGEIESHRLACAFSSCAHDNPEAQNGCAVHRTQGPLPRNGDKGTESEANTNSQ